MTLRLQLSSSQRDDLKIIAEIGPERMAEVTRSLQQRTGVLLRAAELRVVLLERQLEGRQARAIVRQVIALRTLRRQRRIEILAITQAVTEALRSARWDERELAAWERVRPSLDELLSLEAIGIVTKALHLSFDYTNWLEDFRILTDVRPVYDDLHSKMVGAIISQVLRVDFQSSDGSHTLSIALSEEDVNVIQTAAEEALKKAREAKRLLSEKLQLKAFIAGEENYDAD